MFSLLILSIVYYNCYIRCTGKCRSVMKLIIGITISFILLDWIDQYHEYLINFGMTVSELAKMICPLLAFSINLINHVYGREFDYDLCYADGSFQSMRLLLIFIISCIMSVLLTIIILWTFCKFIILLFRRSLNRKQQQTTCVGSLYTMTNLLTYIKKERLSHYREILDKLSNEMERDLSDIKYQEL